MGTLGCECCCTSEDLPNITISGMTASGPWARYDSGDSCCWIRTYTQNTTQPEVLVDSGPLVEASTTETEIWDAALFYFYATWVNSYGCIIGKNDSRKVVGGRVSHVRTSFSNLYFGVLRQKTDVTIILGKIPITCPEDSEPSTRWSLTVLQDGFFRGVKRTRAGTTETYEWDPADPSPCTWAPTFTETSTSTDSGPPSWVPIFGDPAKTAFRTTHTTVLDSLPSGEYQVEDCLNACTSCVDVESCDNMVVTGYPGSVTPCVPYNMEIFVCPGVHTEGSCSDCNGGPVIERSDVTSLGALGATCVLFAGVPTTWNLATNLLAAIPAAFSCPAGEIATCDGGTVANTATGTTGGFQDWIEKSKTCNSTVYAYVSVDVTFPPITLLFP